MDVKESNLLHIWSHFNKYTIFSNWNNLFKTQTKGKTSNMSIILTPIMHNDEDFLHDILNTFWHIAQTDIPF